jgi:hypothetical protein
MANDSVIINVANPSDYVRSDYLDVNMGNLDVKEIPEDGSSFRLYELDGTSKCGDCLPFQIDELCDSEGLKRKLSFFASNVPPGDPDYSSPSKRYVLERNTKDKSHGVISNDLMLEELTNEANVITGVKLGNNTFNVHISLVPYTGVHRDISYSGGVTSMHHYKAQDHTGDGSFLNPYGESREKIWGQIRNLVFFPLPWERRWFHRVDFLEKKYELVWKNKGPIRSVVMLKSEPFKVTYGAKPLISAEDVDLTCYLYRTFSVFTNCAFPYYLEELSVLTDKGVPIAFRPYYLSKLTYPNDGAIDTDFARLEDIPDYYGLWKHFAGQYRGYLCASDTHIRAITREHKEIKWRLSNALWHRCVHGFVFNGMYDHPGDLYHQVGHDLWYEKIFKPLETVPLSHKYEPHDEI